MERFLFSFDSIGVIGHIGWSICVSVGCLHFCLVIGVVFTLDLLTVIDGAIDFIRNLQLNMWLAAYLFASVLRQFK